MTRVRKTILFLILGTCLGIPDAVHPFTSDRLSFSVRVREEISSYRVLGAFVLPEESLEIEVTSGPDGAARFHLEARDGLWEEVGDSGWRWRAPAAKGVYSLRIVNVTHGEAMTLHVFVMVPYQELAEERLEDFPVGAYPSVPFRGLSTYQPPRGFVEVTRDNREVRLSPHFTLGQFVCKQAGGYPKYVVLRERLLLKLERLLEAVNAKGYSAETLHVMSGYRTPAYNKAIGNVKHSRHMYGDAADIFIDERPRDGIMDDLNNDGVSDVRDADILRLAVEEMVGEPWYEPFIGGLGRYAAKPHRGPFIHIDVRGYRARW